MANLPDIFVTLKFKLPKYLGVFFRLKFSRASISYKLSHPQKRFDMKTAEEWQHKRIAKYYQIQSKIYDLSRWAFLFGRRQVIQKLPFNRMEKLHILEVGCGTGINTLELARRFPRASLRALDLSADMLKIAIKKLCPYNDRVFFEQRPYKKGYGQPDTFDLILFSYSLSMIKPGYEALILQAKNNLKQGGLIAVADFHDALWPPYKKFMDSQYITLEAQLLPILECEFTPHIEKIRLSYLLGMWRYLIFIGQKV
jgi:S-adenosylmethionine-diacylgycerolhomoserine-N-methlytransferase